MENKRLLANQANALKGGVKTEKGKEISRLNAIKYGFFSHVVTDYDKADHKAMCAEIYSTFKPTNTYETQLVEILLSNLLAYRRISLIENELMLRRLDPEIVENELDISFGITKVIKEGYRPKSAQR
jgi:hypothetical protein